MTDWSEIDMKAMTIASIVVIGLLTGQIVQSQETTYLSNLGQTSAGSYYVGVPGFGPSGAPSSIAAGFITGTNAGGYMLDSVQFAMTNATGNPRDFKAMLSSSTNAHPGSSLEILNGSTNPSVAGIYTYIPGLSLTLSSNILYFIVTTVGSAAGIGGYEWNYAATSSYNPSGGWVGTQVGGFAFPHAFQSIDNGSSWILLGGAPQFSLDAIAIPEPGFWTWSLWPACYLAGVAGRLCRRTCCAGDKLT
jgi:hypothetical protein